MIILIDSATICFRLTENYLYLCIFEKKKIDGAFLEILLEFANNRKNILK